MKRPGSLTGWRRSGQGLALILAWTALGCGPVKVQVTGKVQFNGKPLTSGYVGFFSPDNQVETCYLRPDGTYTMLRATVGLNKVTVKSPGPPTTDMASREDWPSLSALAMRFGKPHGHLPHSVVLPWYLQFPGQAKRIAGQTGGRMGEQHNAFLIQGDFARADFEIEGLPLRPDVTWPRLAQRRDLLRQVEQHGRTSLNGAEVAQPYQRHCRAAYSLLESNAGTVFDLRREPRSVQERYGHTTVGQSLLLARRLVEAGVSLITVNWQDETKIDGVNTCWDTHQDGFPKMKDLLCPIFDQAFTAFVNDLDERGLLATTLVTAVGEFGRTPRIGQFTQSANTKKTGRDHWPHAFTALLAGGGPKTSRSLSSSNLRATPPVSSANGASPSRAPAAFPTARVSITSSATSINISPTTITPTSCGRTKLKFGSKAMSSASGTFPRNALSIRTTCLHARPWPSSSATARSRSFPTWPTPFHTPTAKRARKGWRCRATLPTRTNRGRSRRKIMRP